MGRSALALTVAAVLVSAAAVPSAYADPGDSAEIAAGWSDLARGRHAEALAVAQRILSAHPRSAAAFTLAVEAAIAGGGPQAGLAEYERWLGKAGLDEPAELRLVAVAVLRQAATESGLPRIEALNALAATGDARAAAALADMAAKASPAELRVLAAGGDERAVDAVSRDLGRGGNALASLEALGKSGSRRAVAAVARRLGDPRPEIRGAAADALGQLGGPEVADRLKPLLSDPSSYVRVRAAAGLYAVGDYSGIGLLQELAAHESAATRLIAAEAMASRPDGTWSSLVRDLTNAAEPEVRLGAARLIAPQDPELARSVLGRLMADDNLAIRELATDALDDVPARDLAALRQLLKARPSTRVRAADRILDVTG